MKRFQHTVLAACVVMVSSSFSVAQQITRIGRSAVVLDRRGSSAGDSMSGTASMVAGTSTYSVNHLIGEQPPTGGPQCFRVTDPAFPGEPDDIVTFDGIPENLATDLNGVVPNVTESETSNLDGTVSISISASSPSLTDLFPGGFVSPVTSQPLTGACWFVGSDDPLDRTPPLTVQSATLTFTSDGLAVVGPADVTALFVTAPWDGFFGVWVPNAADQFTNGVQLDIVFAPATCGNGVCDAGETCASCSVDCGACSACPGTGDCCVDNGTVGCADAICCEAVCAGDAFCCGNDPTAGGVWDAQCANEAATLCPGVPSCPAITCPGTGDCCAVHPELGCADATCCSSVCSADPFCCGNDPVLGGTWDEVCVEEAALLCGTCTTGACCWDSSCSTPGTGAAPVLCGPNAGCACFEVTEGGGGCTAFVDCNAVACPNGTPDCPVGQQCYINTGCGGPICIADCALAGTAAAGGNGVAGRSRRVARVRAEVALRGPVMNCTNSTEVFCTAFGGAYQGDASLCTDTGICAAPCTQAASMDLTALAATEYPCDAILSRRGNNVLRFTFDMNVVAPIAGEIEINKLDPVTGAPGPDISAQFSISIENGNVLKITERSTVFENNAWYAIRNVGNWCEAGNFEVDYGVAWGDADGFGGTGFNDLNKIFDVIQNGLPANSLPDSSRFDIDGFGGVGFNDLNATLAAIGSSSGPKPKPAGCGP